MRVGPEDILLLAIASDPQISPDSRHVAYTLRRPAPDRGSYRAHIFIDGEQVTFADTEDTQPRWSPDGRTLAFVRTSGGISQIWLLGRGEPRPVTALPPGKIQGLAWSPDGRRIAFVFRERPTGGVIARRITRLRYREEGIGWLDPRAHIYVWDGTKTQQLTTGDFDHAHPVWSPDGTKIAFAAARSEEDDYRALHQDIWTIPAEGGELQIIEKPPGPVHGLAWSPDGRFLAFLGHDDPEAPWGAKNSHVWMVPLDGGGPRDATPDLDRTCEDVTITDTRPLLGPAQPPIWAADRCIYFLVSDRGTTHLYALDATGRRHAITHGPRVVKQFSVARDGSIALLAATAQDVGNIFLECGGQETAVARPNDDYFAQRELSRPIPFAARADDGVEIDAWVVLPPGHEPGRRVAGVLQIHGGPRAQYGEVWFHEFHMIAAMGYAVLWSNPRGSQGYGEKFAASIAGAWGDRDYRDLMAVVDAALERFPIDPERLAVMGGSYGGYMTNWIIGHTDRFRCAITMRCVSNLPSMAGTSDFGFEDRREFGVHPWEDFDRLWKMSPLAYAHRMRTPLLILHSEGDLRCPIEQAEQLYAYLKGQRRQVEFVRFPEENHDLSRGGRPDRRVERLRHIAGWLQRHLGR